VEARLFLKDNPRSTGRLWLIQTVRPANRLLLVEANRILCRILESQADAIVRRYPKICIASLRLSWTVARRGDASWRDVDKSANDLWGWVQQDSVAEAFLRAVTDDGGWKGHEVFFIAAPTTTADEDSEALRMQFWPSVPVKGDYVFRGNAGFFDCRKAERLLGWKHP
jgi:hypothetical protein